MLFGLLLAPTTAFAHGGQSAKHDAATEDGPADAELQGKLEVFHEDRHDGGGRYLYILATDGGERVSLEGVSGAKRLRSGDRVRIRGARRGNTVILAADGDVETLAPAVPANIFGAQRTLVILVNFQNDQSQPYTVEYARNVVFTETSNFFKENSFDQTWLAGDVAGWYTIPLNAPSNATECNYAIGGILTHGRDAAAAAGFDVEGYQRFVYAFASAPCGWWGVGTVGGNPSHAWINGSFQLRVVGHELGHNLGLYHSHALDCGSAVVGGSCSSIEYGDTVDIMGSSAGHFNAFQKERLGWLGYGASPPITTVQSAGAYTLDPYAAPANGNPKALKILKSSGTWYYVEFRRPVGFDAFVSSYPGVTNGVVIHTGSDSGANSSHLLDMTPATSSWWDPALAVGKSFTDRDSGVTITTLWANSANAGVAVSFGSSEPVSCVRANPTMTVTPNQNPGAPAGTAVNYTVTVKNNDGDGCSPASFTPQVAVPSGWNAATRLTGVWLSPGATTSTIVQVTSPASAPGGLYPITISFVNSADLNYAASRSATYRVSAFAVTVSTNRSSYPLRSSVYITAKVTDGSSPVDANLTIVVTRPNGARVQKTAPTGSDGIATVSVSIGSSFPKGAYLVQVTASKGGVRVGSATTSFTVQ